LLGLVLLLIASLAYFDHLVVGGRMRAWYLEKE
jgi:hypothetical protein